MLFQIIWKYKLEDENYTKIYYFYENNLTEQLRNLFFNENNNNLHVLNSKVATEILNDMLLTYIKILPRGNVEINRKVTIIIEEEDDGTKINEGLLLEDNDDGISETEDKEYLDGYKIGQEGAKEIIFRLSNDKTISLAKKYGILDGIIDSDINNNLLNGFLKQNKNILTNDILEPSFEHAVFLNKEQNAKLIYGFFQGTKEEIEELLLSSLIYVKSKNCQHASIIENLLKK